MILNWEMMWLDFHVRRVPVKAGAWKNWRGQGWRQGGQPGGCQHHGGEVLRLPTLRSLASGGRDETGHGSPGTLRGWCLGGVPRCGWVPCSRDSREKQHALVETTPGRWWAQGQR